MAHGFEYFCNSYQLSGYTICMIEILEIFWSSPIELRLIILTGLIAIPLLSYFGMKGTGL